MIIQIEILIIAVLKSQKDLNVFLGEYFAKKEEKKIDLLVCHRVYVNVTNSTANILIC